MDQPKNGQWVRVCFSDVSKASKINCVRLIVMENFQNDSFLGLEPGSGEAFHFDLEQIITIGPKVKIPKF